MRYVWNIQDMGYFISYLVPKLLFDDRCFMTRKVLVLVDTTTNACARIIVGSSYKGFSIFETKLSTFECLCILLTIVYYYFYLHQLFFPHHLPTCDVDHKKKTMTNDNIHQKLFESIFIYPNGHNLWFVICDLSIPYIVTLTWFSLRFSSRASSLRAHAIIHPLTIVIPLIQNDTFPSTPPPPSNSKNLDIT